MSRVARIIYCVGLNKDNLIATFPPLLTRQNNISRIVRRKTKQLPIKEIDIGFYEDEDGEHFHVYLVLLADGTSFTPLEHSERKEDVAILDGLRDLAFQLEIGQLEMPVEWQDALDSLFAKESFLCLTVYFLSTDGNHIYTSMPTCFWVPNTDRESLALTRLDIQSHIKQPVITLVEVGRKTVFSYPQRKTLVAVIQHPPAPLAYYDRNEKIVLKAVRKAIPRMGWKQRVKWTHALDKHLPYSFDRGTNRLRSLLVKLLTHSSPQITRHNSPKLKIND